MQNLHSIFLIDDDPVVNMINKKIINMANYTPKVTSFVDAKQALDELNRIIDTDPDDFPEIILLDINMPGMNGWQFLDEYSKLPDSAIRNSHVYMLTSSIDSADMEKSKSYKHVFDFISKPLSVAWLEIMASRRNTIF